MAARFGGCGMCAKPCIGAAAQFFAGQVRETRQAKTRRGGKPHGGRDESEPPVLAVVAELTLMLVL